MRDDINRMLEEHLSKKYQDQRMRMHKKKREELYRLEKEDLPKDAIIIPRKNVKSFFFGALAMVAVLVVVGGVYAAISIGQQLSSSVTTGTAPFSVASTTKVTNLNADLLDDLSSADLQDKPTSWTCTLRSASSTCPVGSDCVRSVTASCTGSEKVISGGCEAQQMFTEGNGIAIGGPMGADRPTGQGWYCEGYTRSNEYVEAYANCCA